MFLQDDFISLRPLEPSDADGPYRTWINDQSADEFTEHAIFPHSLQDLRDFASGSVSSSKMVLAIEDRASSRHVGNIEVGSIDWVHRTATYAIMIAPEAQGKGIGFAASRLLLAHCFRKLNLHRIELGVNAANTAAVKLYEKLGFRREGLKREAFERDGTRFDVITMGLLRHEFELAR